jgi:transcriptional regulator with XRE-family HTH domain
MARLAQRLQRLRLAKDLSRRQLEMQAAIPHGIISRLESGEQAWPSVPVAMRIAKVLGVSVDYLIGMYEAEDGTDESESEPAAVALVGA